MTALMSGLRGVALFALLGGTACTLESLVDVPVPSTVVEPDAVATPTGAMQLYRTAIADLAITFGGGISDLADRSSYISQTGVFTDELQRSLGNGSSGSGGIDERTGSDAGAFGAGAHATLYQVLHHARIVQAQAREALSSYAPDAPKAWQGQLLAYEGYVLLWLAETFCSGIPLTQVPLTGSLRYSRGLTTDELLQQAIALFDAALVAGADSARFVNLAKIGKARALLGLGRQSEAAGQVAGIATDFTYRLAYGTPGGSQVRPASNALGANPRMAQVVDNEGGGPIAWSTDPRTAVTTTPALSGAMRISAKYSVTASGSLDATVAAPTTPIRLADGLEARLIEAEADLSANGSAWLGILNALRATCIGTSPCAPVPGLTTSSLPPLADPGTAAARLDLVMRERALWLFLTGHRQGDLRRMARVYGRDRNSLYPSGTYLNAGFPGFVEPAVTHGMQYGSDVVFLPAADERANNPLYGGCADMNP